MLDNAANKELFEEQMEVLFKCFNEESWSHHGKHYDLPPAVPYRGYDLREITCVPRPIHRPVEMWQPIASGKTLDYIAARGIKGMITLNGERIVDQIFHAYRDAAARAGRTLQLGEDLCWGVGIYLADSEAEAIRQVEPAHDERYKWFAPFGFVRYADEHGRPWGTPGAPARVPTLREGIEQKAWLCGPPRQIVEAIREVEAPPPLRPRGHARVPALTGLYPSPVFFRGPRGPYWRCFFFAAPRTHGSNTPRLALGTYTQRGGIRWRRRRKPLAVTRSASRGAGTRSSPSSGAIRSGPRT